MNAHPAIAACTYAVDQICKAAEEAPLAELNDPETKAELIKLEERLTQAALAVRIRLTELGVEMGHAI